MKYEIPVYCEQIGKFYCCKLLDCRLELVGQNIQEIREQLQSYVREAQDLSDLLGLLSDVKFKMLKVRVRPIYREKDILYPLQVKTTLYVPLIYGTDEHGFFMCYLPSLGVRFWTLEEDTVETMAKSIAISSLEGRSVQEIVDCQLQGRPFLLKIKVKVRKHFKWEGISLRPDDSMVLARLVDEYPGRKAGGKKAELMPQKAWGLEDEACWMASELKCQKACVIAFGHPGVGKSTVIACAINQVKQEVKNRAIRFFKTTPSRMIAGAKYLGEWQKMCDELFNEINLRNGILWIEDFIQLFLLGGEGPEDSIAAYMMYYFQRGKLKVIGEMTPVELDIAKRLLPKFFEYVKLVRIRWMPDDEALEVLNNYRNYINQRFDIEIEDDALTHSVKLLQRFIRSEALPGKAIKFLAECVDDAMSHERNKVTVKDVIRIFKEKTGIAEIFLRDDIPLHRSEVEKFFKSRIIGQDEAIEEVIRIIMILKSGLNDPDRPIATMIFAGPTGVGKTATAKAMAEFIYGKGQRIDPLIRLDMSEFQHPSQVKRLIGEGREMGKLAQLVRERPFSVLLFDEIEKAHPVFFDVLLNVLDEGILYDNAGKIIDFRNCIIVMTTNLGSEGMSSIGFGKDISDVDYISAIKNFFKPEFFNRVDSVVLFNPLSREAVKKITIKELSELEKREGLEKRGIMLHFTDELVEYIAEIGFDPNYGARPLQRAVERLVVSQIADYLLRHPDLRDVALSVDYDGKRVKISVMH